MSVNYMYCIAKVLFKLICIKKKYGSKHLKAAGSVC